jgi:signal transduction histidine kinase
MVRNFRLPMFAVAATMLGLLVLLATLQHRWIGRISDGERERMRTLLNARATAFAEDFDRELTRAYLLFQADPALEGYAAAERLAARYDRWQATARYPRMVGDIFLVSTPGEGKAEIQRFDAAARSLEPAEWPESLLDLETHLARLPESQPPGVQARSAVSVVLDQVPAIVVPAPFIFLSHTIGGPVQHLTRLSFTVVVLDRGYIVDEMLPALTLQHFREAEEGFNYQLAVLRPAAKELVYQSSPEFTPAPDASTDAAVDLFQVRLQQFSAMAAEVRRFTAFVTATPAEGAPGAGRLADKMRREAKTLPPGAPGDRVILRNLTVVQPGGLPAPEEGALTATVATAASAPAGGAAGWRLLVKHPAGSLDVFVQSTRRRNVFVSSGILTVLGVSIGLLVLSTRRAQRLAAQQMEFVAAVSHELRTPLAVIRSAGENLADGVVRSDDQIRKYGDLVRNEGRRLTEMVEQILEFAGIRSGQRGFALRPVAIRPLLEDIVGSSRALIDDAGLTVEIEVPATLPPVAGDEAALRRAFQNLLDNAIKYGAGGGWIGLKAHSTGREVHVSVSDRGIGIAPSETGRIFEPFYRTPEVIAAQIKGAGLGLSLVKRIVEMHAGRISVRSAPAQGSEFVVRLPAASREPVPVAEEDREPRQPEADAAGIRS